MYTYYLCNYYIVWCMSVWCMSVWCMPVWCMSVYRHMRKNNKPVLSENLKPQEKGFEGTALLTMCIPCIHYTEYKFAVAPPL